MVSIETMTDEDKQRAMDITNSVVIFMSIVTGVQYSLVKVLAVSPRVKHTQKHEEGAGMSQPFHGFIKVLVIWD